MEGDAVLSSMDSLWLYSSVFRQPSSKSKHNESENAEEPPQDSTEANKTTRGGRPCQIPKCVKAAASQTGSRRAEGGMVRIAAARGCGEWDERMVAWQKEQRRQALVAAAARCSQQATMPPPGPGEGVAMKAHLRSWAHAVACSVR